MEFDSGRLVREFPAFHFFINSDSESYLKDQSMCYVTARVRICNLYDLSRCIEVELLVDTGSTYTWIRRERLEKLGIKPMTKWKFKTIDGRVIKRDIGEVVMECLGEKATRIVVFAEEGDAEVLGLDALEGLRLEVDPVTRQLKKVEALLAI